jgi:hypothetical protein
VLSSPWASEYASAKLADTDGNGAVKALAQVTCGGGTDAAMFTPRALAEIDVPSAQVRGHPMTAIGYFTRTDTVHIATELRDGGEVVTPIWAVVVDRVPYIRSGYGSGSKWYRRVQRAGRAAFIDGPRRYPVTVENLNDEASNQKVDQAYRAKYVSQGTALRQAVSPQVRARTMRLTPRSR